MSLQRAGLEEVSSALDDMESGGEQVNLLLVRREREPRAEFARLEELLARARDMGVRIEQGSESDLWRMSKEEGTPDVLALVGRPADGTLEEVCARGGLVWLLAGARYAVNIGYSIRTAEVSGAAAVIVDTDISGVERKTAIRTSMRADRFIPVLWEDAAESVSAWRESGFRAIAIEDVGEHEPWDVDLTGDVMLIVGGEHDGVPEAILEQCDDVVNIPMAGFVPSYNLQAPLAVVALEALRQRRSE